MARPVGKINTTGTSAREEDAARAQADLVATKLIPPRPRPGVVVRPRLIRRLDDALSCRLALLSAPAGSGKTTLLGDWLARQQCPVAWVSLDDGDDDPILFWMYVTTALEGALPGATGPALALLRAPRVPPLRNITAVLLNGLGAAEQPVVLVLDDYHAITDQAIHETLGYVIDHLPAHVHVLLASRTDPPLALARLRAHGEILELHADTLRFTTEEAASFLAETMGLQLSPQQTALLETRTEGWIAGLQLAALSLRGQDDVTAFLETFTGSHRYIVDYLTDEVLDRQPGHIREFLLRTSPLDRLCGPLCDAVTGTGAGQEILAYLERAHLFLIPLDHERRWFRYHALFAEALRQRLQEALPADEIAGLHRRASAWIEHEGMLRDAVTHALAGGAMDRAATLVREITEACWKRGDAAAARAVLDALPDTFVQTRPRLCLFRSWMCLVSGRFPAGNHWLDEAERSLDATAAHTEPAEHDALLGALLAIRATLARAAGEYEEATALAHRTLALVPESEPMWRTFAALNLGQIANFRGDVAAARQAYAEAARLSEQSGDEFGVNTAIVGAAGVEEDAGQLHLAADLARRALARYRQRGISLPPTAGYPIVELAALAYEWNQLDEAERLASQSIELGRVGELFDILYNGLVMLARIRQAQGDHPAALQTAREAEQLTQDAPIPGLSAGAAQWTIQLRLMQGDLTAAARWASAAPRAKVGQEPLPVWGPPALLPQALLATGRASASLAVLDGLIATAARLEQNRVLIQALAVRALALHAAGEPSAAAAALERALRLAEPEGFVRSFADLGQPMAALLAQLATPGQTPPVGRGYLATLLAACEETPATPRDGEPLVEDLSAREGEVLRLMAAGAANQEIAETLVVSVHTVKTHVAHILAKLQAANRTQAVARARELRLV